MSRVRSLSVAVMALVSVAALAAVAAQPPEGARRGFRGYSRGSLLGLLRIEQVQKELGLGEQDVAAVRELGTKIREELGEQYAAVREIEDRTKRMAKYTELRDQSDRKAREGLREILSREKLMRLYQIRMQVRSAVDSLGNRYVARRLELTDEQKEKVAKIAADVQAKRTELFGSMRDATDEQRREAFQKYMKARTAANEQALGLLTDEQKKAFEDMKGKAIELPRPGGPR